MLLAQYDSSDDEAGPSTAPSQKVEDTDETDEQIEQQVKTDAFGIAASGPSKVAKVDTKVSVAAAPDVLKEDPNDMANALITRSTDKVINVNISYDDMTRPVQGPVDPFNARKNEGMNALNGHVEEQAMDSYEFERQKRTFDVHGYALDPTANGGGGWIGATDAAAANGFGMIDNVRATNRQRKEMKRKRKAKGDASIVDGEGSYLGPWADYQGDKAGEEPEVEEEETDEWRAEKKRREDLKAAAQERNKAAREEKSIFHGKELTDYAGRTYMHIPTDVDVRLNPPDDAPAPNAYVPERCIHTWHGHNKGVTAVRLFPKSGHLLLSGSMDTKIKLWDVYHEGNVLRTFMGHSQAVKDVNFNNKGTRLISSSFDRTIKVWDTETGQCVQAFSNGKIANVVKFQPDPDKQNIFLAGMQDKKIVQYDLRSHEIVQTYDQHLGPVNTITFIDNNRRFLTTSDDKTIRGWDYDIPVVIKYIAEPYMHSMPAAAKHPNGKYVAFQSLDNQIQIYDTVNGIRQHKKKHFSGHTTAGYACGISFSPDGKYISSGTGGGDVVFWDWKTGRIVKRLNAHKQVVIDHCWLPNEHVSGAGALRSSLQFD